MPRWDVDVVESNEAYRGKSLLVRSLAGHVSYKEEAVEGCRRVLFAGFRIWESVEEGVQYDDGG